MDGISDTPPDKVLEVTYKGEDFSAIKKEFDEYIREKERREKLLIFDEWFYYYTNIFKFIFKLIFIKLLKLIIQDI